MNLYNALGLRKFFSLEIKNVLSFSHKLINFIKYAYHLYIFFFINKALRNMILTRVIFFQMMLVFTAMTQIQMMEMLPQTDQQHHFQLRHQVVLPVLEHAKLHPFLLKAQIVNKDSHIVREVESYPVHKVVVPLIVVLVVVELEDIDHLIMLLLV